MNDRKAIAVDIGLKAVAKSLNLSASTVSRALNGVNGVNPATRKLVQEAAKEMGYFPHLGAKQLVGKGSNMIGLFIPQFEFETSSGFVDMFPPLQRAMQGYGKDALIFSIPYSQYPRHRFTECVSSRRLEGCLIFSAFSESHPMMQEALALQIPCVNFEGVVGPSCSAVVSDDRAGGRMAAEKLIEAGHRIIGYINGAPHIRQCKERYEGFCEALREAGIEHENKLVAIGNFSGASGAEAAMALVEKNPDMTGIFCANDLMAMGAIMALTERGIRIPDRISVVGYDGDVFSAYTSPPLTTIRHSQEEISARAVALLMELLAGKPGRRETVSPMPVERRSIVRLPEQ